MNSRFLLGHKPTTSTGPLCYSAALHKEMDSPITVRQGNRTVMWWQSISYLRTHKNNLAIATNVLYMSCRLLKMHIFAQFLFIFSLVRQIAIIFHILNGFQKSTLLVKHLLILKVKQLQLYPYSSCDDLIKNSGITTIDMQYFKEC